MFATNATNWLTGAATTVCPCRGCGRIATGELLEGLWDVACASVGTYAFTFHSVLA